jgi:tetratricopeptide (TPR) repeat protein
MGRKLRRKELKQPDSFLTTTERLLEGFRNHPRKVMAVGLTLAILLAVALAVRVYRESRGKSYGAAFATAYEKLRRGELAQGAEEFERASDLAPDPSDASLALAFAGNLFAEIGEDARAETAFRRLRETAKLPELRQIAAYNLAMLALRKGSPPEAERFFTEAMGLPGAFQGAAWMALRLRRPDEDRREEDLPPGIPPEARAMFEASARVEGSP